MQTNCSLPTAKKNNLVLHATAPATMASSELLTLRLFPEAYETMHLGRNRMAEPNLKTTAAAVATTQAKPPAFFARLGALLSELGLSSKISVALTGFAGNQVKVYLAEIGLVATAAGYYNLHLGGKPETKTLNRIYKYNLTENEILNELAALLLIYKVNGKTSERFGDFVNRTNLI